MNQLSSAQLVRPSQALLILSESISAPTTYKQSRLPSNHHASDHIAGKVHAPTANLLSVLIVDDEHMIASACKDVLLHHGFQAEMATSIQAAKYHVERELVDLVITDLRVADQSGLELLQWLRRNHPHVSVIVMTAFATTKTAVSAMQIGATDYLVKPFLMEELFQSVQRAAKKHSFDLELRQSLEGMRSASGFLNLVGISPPMEKLYRLVARVAESNHPVMIVGEKGTGKKLFAQAVHLAGVQADRPFHSVGCGSLSGPELDNRLFGNQRVQRSDLEGLLFLPSGGTVLLDDVDRISSEAQYKLINYLQAQRQRLAKTPVERSSKVRLLASTSADMDELVRVGKFRRDLLAHLQVLSLKIPPLRARRADINLLAESILARLRSEHNRPYTLSPDALDLLVSYEWPNNVSELYNTLEASCISCTDGDIRPEHFPQLVSARVDKPQLETIDRNQSPFGFSTASSGRSTGLRSLPDQHSIASHTSIAELERTAILDTVHRLNGDKLLAARVLGIGKTTLYRKLKEYAISNPPLAA